MKILVISDVLWDRNILEGTRLYTSVDVFEVTTTNSIVTETFRLYGYGLEERES